MRASHMLAAARAALQYGAPVDRFLPSPPSRGAGPEAAASSAAPPSGPSAVRRVVTAIRSALLGWWNPDPRRQRLEAQGTRAVDQEDGQLVQEVFLDDLKNYHACLDERSTLLLPCAPCAARAPRPARAYSSFDRNKPAAHALHRMTTTLTMPSGVHSGRPALGDTGTIRHLDGDI